METPFLIPADLCEKSRQPSFMEGGDFKGVRECSVASCHSRTQHQSSQMCSLIRDLKAILVVALFSFLILLKRSRRLVSSGMVMSSVSLELGMVRSRQRKSAGRKMDSMIHSFSFISFCLFFCHLNWLW